MLLNAGLRSADGSEVLWMTPHTLHLTPYILHLQPQTLNPKP